MKSLKFLAAGALALTLVGTASAQTVIRITGSSAYRAATNNAILNIMDAGRQYGYVGSTFSSSSQAIFVGSVGGTSVIIKTNWTGSVAGIQTVSQGIATKFVPNNAAVSAAGTSGLPAGEALEVPQVALSDVFQASTPFPLPVMFDTQVGVVPFKWVASFGAPEGLKNVTPQLASAVFLAGQLPLSLFTGVSADVTTPVFAIGRDFDSGTRLTAVAETGIGVASALFQYKPAHTGTKTSSQVPWPHDTLLGIPYDDGNGGFNSGGSLADEMRFQTTGADTIGGYYITYLSVGDAARATSTGTAGAGNAKELTYNGVAYSETAVREGQYTFWGYEHLMYRNDLDQAIKNIANTLATRIESQDAGLSGIFLNTMKVSRQTDGGQVGAN